MRKVSGINHAGIMQAADTERCRKVSQAFCFSILCVIWLSFTLTFVILVALWNHENRSNLTTCRYTENMKKLTNSQVEVIILYVCVILSTDMVTTEPDQTLGDFDYYRILLHTNLTECLGKSTHVFLRIFRRTSLFSPDFEKNNKNKNKNEKQTYCHGHVGTIAFRSSVIEEVWDPLLTSYRLGKRHFHLHL